MSPFALLVDLRLAKHILGLVHNVNAHFITGMGPSSLLVVAAVTFDG